MVKINKKVKITKLSVFVSKRFKMLS